MHVSEAALHAEPIGIGWIDRADPRAQMARRLPRALQPFLTWLTAMPAPGEPPVARSPGFFVWSAALQTLGGTALTFTALLLLGYRSPIGWILAFIGMAVTTSGLGLFQVVVFHHCSHGTVFGTRPRNKAAGRLISALLLFKHFDLYQREHMVHHNAVKLFTAEDEFTDFVIGICDLAPEMSRDALWRRLVLNLLSPAFHAGFLVKRLKGGLRSFDIRHNLIGLGFLLGVIAAGSATRTLDLVLIAWLLPLTVLLQAATVFRILCEHRLPPAPAMATRDRGFVAQATAGVFPGAMPPALSASSLAGLAAWAGWWANMLTVQLLVRVTVLVGDAPCHDYHHRRPAGRGWTGYAHNRQADVDAGCPGYPLNYASSWGLFTAIDENFRALAATAAADLLG